MGKFLNFLLTEGKKSHKEEDYVVNLIPHVDGVTFCGLTKKDHELAYKAFGTHRPARLSVTKNEHGMKMAHAETAKAKGYIIRYHNPKS